MMSKIYQKFVTTSKVHLWHQKVCHDIMTSTIHHVVKNMSSQSKKCHCVKKYVKKIVMTSKNMSSHQKVCHDVKYMLCQIVHLYIKNRSCHHKICQKIVKKIVKNRSCHQKVLLWCRCQKYVMTSKICRDIKKCVMTSKSVSRRQRVHHDVKICVMTSTSVSWHQKYIMTSQCQK